MFSLVHFCSSLFKLFPDAWRKKRWNLITAWTDDANPSLCCTVHIW